MAVESPTNVLDPQVRAFLTDVVRYATIATINRDGSPHQSVVWFLLRDEAIVVNSREGRRWPSNLRRDTRVSFAVEEGENAVTIDAVAEFLHSDERAQSDIAEMARRYDTPDDAQREVARFKTEERISFALKPVKVHVHGEIA